MEKLQNNGSAGWLRIPVSVALTLLVMGLFSFEMRKVDKDVFQLQTTHTQQQFTEIKASLHRIETCMMGPIEEIP